MNLINQLLIATPEMRDPRFTQAVILICEHNEHGALGININDLSDVTFDEILKSLHINLPKKSYPHAIYEGGPVNSQCGFILHQSEPIFDSTIQISSAVHLTTSKDIIQAIADDKVECDWLMALGCATWESGQLEQEIADHDWLITPSQDDLVFDHQNNKWDMALALIGIEAHQLSGDVGHA